MKKWKREDAAKQDKEQATLNPYSPSFIKTKQEQQVSVTGILTGKYSCVFCLYSGRIEEFLISRKKGYDKRLVHCPECGQNMELRSLTAKWTPEEYADFLYRYSCQGGWQKVRFKIWSERLKEIGWSERFWLRYKELKGDSDQTESYEKHIMRQQEEEAREKGYIP